jgi:hypothetical protein
MKRKSNQNSKAKKDRIEEILSDDKKLTAILRKAVREAVKAHQLAGNPVATLKNGKAVWVETK